ncbi:MAG TPA: hypothetical protein VIK81_03055 [Patescibacteria group bacterium]
MPQLSEQRKINYFQKGVVSPLVLIIVIILIGVFFGWLMLSGQFSSKKSTEQTTSQSPKKAAVDKTDTKWLEKYCREEMAKLPEAPFTYKSKVDVYLTMADVFIKNRIPEEKRYKEETCQIDYKYEDNFAYPSVGVEYKFDINHANQFHENVDNLITSRIDSSWKKFSPVSKEEGGRPFYVYEGFPLAFTRENPSTGTVDYAYYDFGALTLYASFSTYEK